MKRIFTILAIGFVVLGTSGCKYKELPPKTTDAAKSYNKPSGEIPTQAERDEVAALKAEYEAAVKDAKD